MNWRTLQSQPVLGHKWKTAILGLGSLTAAVLGTILHVGSAQAQEAVRIGLPAKAYWTTVTTQAAQEQGLFKKEGLAAEVTAYRSSAEAFEALAAGATDLVLGPPSLVAGGLTRGVQTKVVAGGANGVFGWYLATAAESKISSVKDLEGKNVGMSAAGSVTDLLARWEQQNAKVDFTRVPVGSSGVLPSLLSGNVAAAVIFPPLSYQVIAEGKVRPLLEFSEKMPPVLFDAWITSDKLIAEKPAIVQKALNAVFGGLLYVREHRQYAVKLISAVHEVPEAVATKQYEGVVLKLLPDGQFKPEWITTWLDLAKLGGMTGLAPTDATYTTRFKPVPTRP